MEMADVALADTVMVVDQMLLHAFLLSCCSESRKNFLLNDFIYRRRKCE